MFETFQKRLPIKLSTIVSIALSFLVIGVVAYLCVWNIRTNEGIWITHDDVQVSRTLLMVEELQSGQFPVRIVSSLAGGAGYMLFHFNSPAIYYLTAAGVLSGINPVNVTKLAFQLAYIFAGVGMLFFLKRLPASWFLSAAGSILLLTSAYFNYDVYYRGALPEVWGFAFIPWLFFLYQAYSCSKQKWYLLGLALVAAGMVYAVSYTHLRRRRCSGH